MADQQTTIERLQLENDDLRERIAHLEAALGMNINPHVVLGLTPHEAAIFGILVERGSATRDQIMHALYALRHDGEEPEVKIVDVLVCKARKKLQRFSISIETVWGQGYRMSAECRDRARKLTTEGWQQ